MNVVIAKLDWVYSVICISKNKRPRMIVFRMFLLMLFVFVVLMVIEWCAFVKNILDERRRMVP